MYVTTRDIVIPAGTEVAPAPFSTHHLTPHGEVLIEFDKDSTGSLRFDIEEAESAGAIKPVEEDNGWAKHANKLISPPLMAKKKKKRKGY